MNSPEVFILILNWNGWENTIECLESLQELTYSNYRIVVVDNGSTDGSIDKIKAWADGALFVQSKFFIYHPTTKPVRWIVYDHAIAELGGLPQLEAKIESLPSDRRIVLIQTDANLGFAGGNNVGIRYAVKKKADYVWLLNNDTVVDKEALSYAINYLNFHPETSSVQSLLLNYFNPTRIDSFGQEIFKSKTARDKYHGVGLDSVILGDNGENIEVFGPCAASAIYRGSIFLDMLFDEKFFTIFEDVDLSFRMRIANCKCVLVMKAKVFHKRGISGEKGFEYQKSLKTYLTQRNSIALKLRYWPLVYFITQPRFWLSILLVILNTTVTRNLTDPLKLWHGSLKYRKGFKKSVKKYKQWFLA